MGQKHTKRTIEAMQPRAAKYDVFDSTLPGFCVRVMPSGVKQFSVLYRAGTGRTAPKKRITIGRFGTITVEQARQQARKVLADVTRGQDPARERDAMRTAMRMTDLGEQFLNDVAARRKPRTHEAYAALWRTYIEPKLGRLLVQDVTVNHVASLHRGLREKLYTANRALAVIGACFAFAERHGVRTRGTNPARDVEPYPERSRERYLSPEEFARLAEALTRAEQVGLPPAPTKRRLRTTGPTAKHRPKHVDVPTPANSVALAAIRFLMLTGWREQEVLQLQWSEVNLERGIADLNDTKTGRSKRQLGAPAVLLLSELSKGGEGRYVFPGKVTRRPLADISRIWYAVRHAAGLGDVRLHDLRHSFASVLASAGVSLLMIGKILGHRDTATTSKYAHLLDDPVRASAGAAGAQIIAWGAAARSGPPHEQSQNAPAPAAASDR